MKRAALLAGVILGLFIFLRVAEAAEKMAYVDLSRIFSEYNKTKDYDKALSAKEDSYTADREKKVDEIKQFQDKLDLMSDKEKDSKKSILEEKIKTFRDSDRQKQTDLRKEQDEKMKDILKDIDEAVKKYAEKQGYTLVFNDRVLIYQAKNLDITTSIIEILNAGYKNK